MKRGIGRRGQDASNAALLVGIITVILVFYILFLPPAEREELLGEGVDPGDKPGAAPIEEFLLKANPGTLEYYQPGGDHLIPSVHIFSSVEAVEIAEIPQFMVKNGWFVSQDKTVRFQLTEQELLERVVLSFVLPQHEGILTVNLNGEDIFSSEIDTYNAPPIILPKQFLRESNELKFSVNAVGMAFWNVNTYDLRNVKVIGDVRDVSRQESKSIFTLSPTEKRNLLGASLFFIAACDPSEAGVLKVNINENTVYSAVPDCDTANMQTVSPGFLLEGANTITFFTTKGDYRIEQVKLHTELKPIRTFVEYFEVEPSLYDAVVSGAEHLYLEIDFVDDGQRKRGELNLNGHVTFIDQNEPYYTRLLDHWIQPGARNYIEIVPETPLHIPEVRVLRKSVLPSPGASQTGKGQFPSY